MQIKITGKRSSSKNYVYGEADDVLWFAEFNLFNNIPQCYLKKNAKENLFILLDLKNNDIFI